MPAFAFVNPEINLVFRSTPSHEKKYPVSVLAGPYRPPVVARAIIFSDGSFNRPTKGRSGQRTVRESFRPTPAGVAPTLFVHIPAGRRKIHAYRCPISSEFQRLIRPRSSCACSTIGPELASPLIGYGRQVGPRPHHSRVKLFSPMPAASDRSASSSSFRKLLGTASRRQQSRTVILPPLAKKKRG